MRSVWVDRDQAGNIISVYSVAQGGRQLEKILEDDPEVQAFLNPPETIPTDEEVINSFFHGSKEFEVIFEILFELYALIPGPPVDRAGFDEILKSKLP